MKLKLIKKIKGPTAVFKIFKTRIKGKEITEDMVEFPKTVAILPLMAENKIVLIKQYRFPVKKELWEVPAGKLRKNEKPEIGAKRELREETGLEAKKLEKIGQFYLSPGYSTEFMYLFRAKNLRKGKQSLDKDEIIKKVKVFPFKKALRMIKQRKIIDAKTILALFLTA